MIAFLLAATLPHVSNIPFNIIVKLALGLAVPFDLTLIAVLLGYLRLIF